MTLQEQLKKWAADTNDDKIKEVVNHADTQFKRKQDQQAARTRRREREARKTQLATDKVVRKHHEAAVTTVANKVVDAMQAEADLTTHRKR